MEYIDLLFKPIMWAFSCLMSENVTLDGVPVWSIYVAAIIIGLVITYFVPLSEGVINEGSEFNDLPNIHARDPRSSTALVRSERGGWLDRL